MNFVHFHFCSRFLCLSLTLWSLLVAFGIALHTIDTTISDGYHVCVAVAASKTSDTTLDALADELLKGDASSAPGAQVSKSEEVKVFADVGLKCKVCVCYHLSAPYGLVPTKPRV